MPRLEIKQSDSGLYCQILEIWELVVSCEKNEIHVLFLDSFNDLHSCLKTVRNVCISVAQLVCW